MTHLTYLVALLVPLAALAAVDRHRRLVLWAHPVRGVAVLALGSAAFLGWDLLALAHGFYRRGGSPLMTGVDVAPDLPVEELFFVLFLCYLGLVLHRLAYGLLGRARRKPAPNKPAHEKSAHEKSAHEKSAHEKSADEEEVRAR
jgi:lycopene cyclase domain-containing protein